MSLNVALLVFVLGGGLGSVAYAQALLGRADPDRERRYRQHRPTVTMQ